MLKASEQVTEGRLFLSMVTSISQDGTQEKRVWLRDWPLFTCSHLAISYHRFVFIFYGLRVTHYIFHLPDCHNESFFLQFFFFLGFIYGENKIYPDIIKMLTYSFRCGVLL